MSYLIEYKNTKKQRGNKGSYVRLPLLTVISFFIFLLLVSVLWPEGTEFLQNLLPVSALNQLALEFLNGETIKASISDFFHTCLA